MELHPGNENGIKMLAELGVDYQPIDVKVDPSILQTYTGKYEIMPEFVIEITLENNHLFGVADGLTKAEFFALSDTKFYLKVGDVQVVFNKNDQKEVDSITINTNDEVMIGKKIN